MIYELYLNKKIKWIKLLETCYIEIYIKHLFQFTALWLVYFALLYLPITPKSPDLRF